MKHLIYKIVNIITQKYLNTKKSSDILVLHLTQFLKDMCYLVYSLTHKGSQRRCVQEIRMVAKVSTCLLACLHSTFANIDQMSSKELWNDIEFIHV